MSDKRKMESKIIKIKDFLCIKKIEIPEYQRPYKWQPKNVRQLIEDIIAHKDKSAYRIGTAVMYDDKYEDKDDDKKSIKIVDGQQRLITMSLIANALKSLKDKEGYVTKLLSDKDVTILNQTFKSETTKNNIVINYNEIKREVANFTKDEMRFFFEKCELVCITLFDISEAFQFFDSQNARGKDLDPHDLLKAFHLREMLLLPETEREKCIEDWENRNDEELSELFGQYLFRVRRWSKRKNGRYLNKSNASIFKGISLDDNVAYPFTYPLRINNVFTDDFNQHLHRKIDNNLKSYPFQIDQVVINGKRFFEMTAFYQNKIDAIKNTHEFKGLKDNRLPEQDEFLMKLQFLNITTIGSLAYKILEALATYNGRNRTGDKYVRNLFDCALLYYTDKFGTKDFEKVIVKIFIWSYSLRLNQHSVQLASADNRAIEWDSIFAIIREATEPKEVYQIYLPLVKENKSSNTEKIEKLFTDLNYYKNVG